MVPVRPRGNPWGPGESSAGKGRPLPKSPLKSVVAEWLINSPAFPGLTLMGGGGAGVSWEAAVRDSHQGSDPELVLLHVCVYTHVCGCVCVSVSGCGVSPPAPHRQ